MSFSDLTPQNTITDDDGNTIGISGAPVYVTGNSSAPVTTQFASGRYDAFGRMRVSEQVTLFEYSAKEGLSEERYITSKLTGGGTAAFDSASISAKLSVSTSGDEVITQSRRRVEYNKGHSQLIYMTGRFGTPTANVRQRRGYYCLHHGIYTEIDGTTAYVAIRSSLSGSAVDTRIAQSSWNVDTLDGSSDANNPSGLEWEPTKQTVYVYDFGWLGSLGVRFYIIVGNIQVLVHEYAVSSVLDAPYMDSGMAPLRTELKATSTISGTHSMYTTCGSVKSEGSPIQVGRVRDVNNGTTAISISTTPKVVAGIRLKSSKVDGSILPMAFNVQPASGTDIYRWQIIYNATLTSPTWTDLDGLAQGLTNNPAFTGGSVLASGYGDLGTSTGGGGGGGSSRAQPTLANAVESDVFLGSDVDEDQDNLIFVVETVSGSGSIFFSGQYREFF